MKGFILVLALVVLSLIALSAFAQSDAGFLNDGLGGLGCFDHVTGRLVAVVPGEITTISQAQAWCDSQGY